MQRLSVAVGFMTAIMSALPALADTAAAPAGSAKSAPAAQTPAEIAVQAVQENDPAELSFGDWEFILSLRDASPANKQAADKVWRTIMAKQKGGKARLKIPVAVIAATANAIDAAITDDNRAAKQADLHVKLTKPLRSPPAVGSSIEVIGILTGYRTKPFLFTMNKGEIAASAPGGD